MVSEEVRLVFDASSLINIEDAGRLDSLTPLGRIIIVPDKVCQELDKIPRGGHRPGKRYRLMTTWLKRASFDRARFLVEESRRYLELNLTLGKGEAAAIAVAERRSALLVIDDQPARAMAESLGIECMNAGEFLRWVDNRNPRLL